MGTTKGISPTLSISARLNFTASQMASMSQLQQIQQNLQSANPLWQQGNPQPSGQPIGSLPLSHFMGSGWQTGMGGNVTLTGGTIDVPNFSIQMFAEDVQERLNSD